MMVLKTCCMTSCDNDSENGDSKITYFPFPKDFDLCMQWVQNSGKPELFEQFAFEGALPFLTRYICSDHFGDSDYLDVTNRDLGLKPNAIPRLNLILCPTEPEVDIGENIENIDIKQEPLESEEFADMTDQKPIDNEDPLKVPIPPLKFGDEGFYDSLHLSTMLNGDGSYTSNESCDSISQTDEGRALRDLFFCRYETAVDTENRKRRMNETEEQRKERLQRAASEAKRKRTTETEEEKKLRRMKNALATALRRRRETPEQTAARREKGRIRARLKRMTETEEQTKARREKGRIRARLKRMTETEEESKARRLHEAMRVAERRRNETPEQRERRLKREAERVACKRQNESPEQKADRRAKDRERMNKKRMLKRILKQIDAIYDTATANAELAGVKIKDEPADDETEAMACKPAQAWVTGLPIPEEIGGYGGFVTPEVCYGEAGTSSTWMPAPEVRYGEVGTSQSGTSEVCDTVDKGEGCEVEDNSGIDGEKIEKIADSEVEIRKIADSEVDRNKVGDSEENRAITEVET